MPAPEPIICDCKGLMFEEVWVTQILTSVEPEKSQTGKMKMVLGTGKYVYRCAKCSKLLDFAAEEDLPPAKRTKKSLEKGSLLDG